MAKILSVYNRLQAGYYENGNGARVDLLNYYLLTYLLTYLLSLSTQRFNYLPVVKVVSMRCLQSEGDVLKRLRPIIAEFFDVNESTVSPLIAVVYT